MAIVAAAILSRLGWRGLGGPPQFPLPTPARPDTVAGAAPPGYESYSAITSGVAAFPGVGLSQAPEANDPWRAVVASESNYDGVLIAAEMQSPLPLGNTIVKEWRDPSVGPGLAMSLCYQGEPSIVYDEGSLARMSIHSFRFLRMHEYAHHTERHEVCPNGGQQRPRSEADADCAAAASLRGQGGVGGLAVGAFIERLGLAQQIKWDVYPLPLDRRKKIESCFI